MKKSRIIKLGLVSLTGSLIGVSIPAIGQAATQPASNQSHMKMSRKVGNQFFLYNNDYFGLKGQNHLQMRLAI